MNLYFPESCERSNGIDTSTLASKTGLAGLKSKIDNLDVDKLKADPVDLSKPSNIVNNDIVKKPCIINWLPKSALLILRYQTL